MVRTSQCKKEKNMKQHSFKDFTVVYHRKHKRSQKRLGWGTWKLLFNSFVGWFPLFFLGNDHPKYPQPIRFVCPIIWANSSIIPEPESFGHFRGGFPDPFTIWGRNSQAFRGTLCRDEMCDQNHPVFPSHLSSRDIEESTIKEVDAFSETSMPWQETHMVDEIDVIISKMAP